ncbi:MAG: hypothetical protein AABZ47_18425 [Planctomycetota bacterium]
MNALRLWKNRGGAMMPLVLTLMTFVGGWRVEEPSPPPTAPPPQTEPITPPTTVENPAAKMESPVVPKTEEPAIKPRAEVLVPSVRELLSEVHRSKGGILVRAVADILFDRLTANVDGMGREEVLAVVDQIRSWPDSSLTCVLFAPDPEGRARWALRVDWPLAELFSRVETLVGSPMANELFQGLKLSAKSESLYEIALPDGPVAYLIAAGSTRALIASHSDLTVPTDVYAGETVEGLDGRIVAAARVTMGATEKDSGATFLSSFSMVTSVDYSGAVGSNGEWNESVQVRWPPLSGMGAKALFGRVKHTFFVPESAFGALALHADMAAGLLETFAGFGPQMFVEDGGGFSFVGERAIGPIAKNMRGEFCVTLLPGNGLLPMPDVLVQTRVKKPDGFTEDVRAATGKINQLFRERDRKEPWHEVKVRDRTVFWRDAESQGGMGMMPLVLRPVVFATQETDGEGKEKDVAVVAWTSTSPESLVRRWLDFPRSKERRDHPVGGKTDGQLWVNWPQVYRWVQPYVGVVLSVASVEALLPGIEEMKSVLTTGTVNATLRYAGLTVTHRGPIPAGAVVIPGFLAGALGASDAGGSDVARERYASQRLRVLYHHSKLFKKDLGRWPAEIEELDGYVDFEGNPGLLALQLSAKKQWSEWWKETMEASKKKVEDEIDEDKPKLRGDQLYVIEWGKERWSLGFAPTTFEHLEKMYIDQDGMIHRVERKEAVSTVGTQEAGSAAKE